MAKTTCKTCEWFVAEKDPGEFSHEYAKQTGVGFCVLADLFTYTEATDQACSEYQKESE